MLTRQAKINGLNLREASGAQKKAFAKLRKLGWDFDGPPPGNIWLSLVRILPGGKCEFGKLHGDGRFVRD